MSVKNIIYGGYYSGGYTYPDFIPSHSTSFMLDVNGWPANRTWYPFITFPIKVGFTDADGSDASIEYIWHRHLLGTNTDTVSVRYCHLVVDGNIVATNRYSNLSITKSSAIRFTGTPAQWGLASNNGLELKSNNCGVVFSFYSTQLDKNTDRVMISGIDLSAITSEVTIGSIDIDLSNYVLSDATTTTADVGYATMTITGTVADVTMNLSMSTHMLATVGEFKRSYDPLEVTYDVTRKDGLYMGQMRTNSERPSILSEINNIHSKMSMTLAQNDESKESQSIDIMTEISENILTESGYKIVGDISTPIGLGEGTNIDTNVEIDMSLYYGDWVPWLTEDNKYIITEQDAKLIVVAEGRPDGVKRFGGYVSRWRLSGSKVGAVVLSHAQELRNILVETESKEAFNIPIPTQRGVLSLTEQGGGPTDAAWDSLAQVFTFTGGTKSIGSIVLPYLHFQAPASSLVGNVSASSAIADIIVEIHTGSPITIGAIPPTLGVPYARGTFKLSLLSDPYSGRIYTGRFYYDLLIQLDKAKDFISGNTYTMVLKTKNLIVNDGAAQPIFRSVFTYINGTGGNTYGGASMRVPRPGYLVADLLQDIPFTLMEATGVTKRNWYSVDPSIILMDILRFAQSKGSRVQFSTDTIEMTGTLVTFEINANTADEAIDSLLKLFPADWYIWYDHGTDEVHAHPRPTEVTQLLEKGKNVVNDPEPTLEKSIEELKNDVLFSGGDLGGGENLLVREEDATSINDIRRGFYKFSDSRYKDEDSARIVARGEIDRYKDPQFSAEAAVIQERPNYPIDIKLGELAQYSGFSPIMDAPEMQISQIVDRLEVADLKMGTLKPRVSKRIQDIKRNVSNLEAENNPDQPAS